MHISEHNLNNRVILVQILYIKLLAYCVLKYLLLNRTTCFLNLTKDLTIQKIEKSIIRLQYEVFYIMHFSFFRHFEKISWYIN